MSKRFCTHPLRQQNLCGNCPERDPATGGRKQKGISAAVGSAIASPYRFPITAGYAAKKAVTDELHAQLAAAVEARCQAIDAHVAEQVAKIERRKRMRKTRKRLKQIRKGKISGRVPAGSTQANGQQGQSSSSRTSSDGRRSSTGGIRAGGGERR